jgi:hypothetical protein
MIEISQQVNELVHVPLKPLFDWFIPVKLEAILPGYGPLPGVVGTSEQSGPWDVPGSSRLVHLADGNSAFEQVTACEPPHYFAYRVGGFSNFLKHLVEGAEGQWWFESDAQNTLVTWQYTFLCRNIFAALVMFPIVRFFGGGICCAV